MTAKAGPPAKNLNSLKNGSRLHRLAVGNLPPQLSRVQRYQREYRRTLESEVAAVYGEVDLVHAHYLDSAAQHEATRMICRWVLRERWDQLTPADIERCSATMASATDRRNAAVAKLNLDSHREEHDPWMSLQCAPLDDSKDTAEIGRVNSDPSPSDGTSCNDGGSS